MAFDIKIDTAKFADIESKLIADAKTVLAGSALKQEVGDFAVQAIQYQTRVGQPYNSGKDLPLLKESTIKNREYLSKYNKTHDVFDVGFSNLTITGELLDSLTWSDEGDCLLKLEFVGSHAPYRGKNGFIGKEIDNSTLVGYLAQKGFTIFDSSLAQNKQFISRIKTICLRYIRRGLRVRSALGAYD